MFDVGNIFYEVIYFYKFRPICKMIKICLSIVHIGSTDMFLFLILVYFVIIMMALIVIILVTNPHIYRENDQF